MRSRPSPPRRLRDGPRVVLGVASVVGWMAAFGAAVESLPDAIGTTGAWLRRTPAGGERTTAGDVALAWLLVPVSILTLVLATLLVPLLVIRGVLALLALLKESDRAWELRRVVAQAASERAVFVSYRTAPSGPDALDVSQALQAAEHPAWLDGERGTLPTHLFFVDHVLEDAVRNARAVVVLHQPADQDESYAESLLDRTDLVIATSLRWMVFVPFAFLGIMSAPFLLLPGLALLPHVVEERPSPRRTARMVPPEVRRWWYRSLSGADIGRRPGERWQAWEQRLASLYGLPTVTVAVVEDARAAPPGVDVVLARGTIGHDVRARLIPALATATPDPAAPLALARAQMRAAAAVARAHPLKAFWRAAVSGGREDEPAVAALLRRVAG